MPSISFIRLLLSSSAVITYTIATQHIIQGYTRAYNCRGHQIETNMGLCQKHSEGGGVPKIYGRSILKRTFTNPLATTVQTPLNFGIKTWTPTIKKN